MSSISEFFRMFKVSLRLEWLTDLDAKGAKRSVKMWATNFYKSLFKNILLYMNCRLSKIRSVHTYEVRYIHVFAGQTSTTPIDLFSKNDFRIFVYTILKKCPFLPGQKIWRTFLETRNTQSKVINNAILTNWQWVSRQLYHCQNFGSCT